METCIPDGKLRKIVHFKLDGANVLPEVRRNLNRTRMSNDYPTRQEEELEVLRSIYLEDVVDLRSKKIAWKVWQPVDVKIRLRPQESMTSHGAYAELTLRVLCGPSYPDSVPTMEVLDSNNVPSNFVTELLSDLKKLADELKGEVMILNLCQRVQEFLVPFNMPSVSIYDEMILNKRKLQEERELEQKTLQAKKEEEEEKQRLELAREIRVKQEQLKEEARRRRANSIGQSDMRLSYSSDNSPDDSESSLSCKGHKSTQIRITINGKERVLQRGRCIGHSSRGNITFTAMEVSSGEVFCLREWILLPKDDGTFLSPLQESLLEDVESQFGKLCRVQHPNLIRFFGILQESQKDKISISIVQEMLTGHAPLTLHMSRGVALDLQVLRLYCQDILSALLHLHQNDLTHGDLRVGNVFVNQKGSLKTGNFGVVKNLHELMRISQGRDDSKYMKIGKSDAKKFDVFQLGVLMLSLAKGSKVREEAAKVPSSLPSDFQDFLQKCLAVNEAERWDIEQLQQHRFITQKVTYRKSLQLSSQATSDSDIESLASSDEGLEPENSASTNRMLTSYNSLSSTSRLRTEFEILKFLGSGGFGSVIKVRNKLDSRVYAIKQIPLDLRHKNLHRRITREVMLLSRLNHENVVRYYNSWIEVADIQKGPGQETFSTSPRKCQSLSFALKQSLLELEAPAFVEGTTEWSVSLSHVVQNGDDDSSDSSEDNELFDLGPKSDSSQIMFEHSGDSSSSEDEDEEKQQTSRPSSSTPQIQFMFIQMEFCEKQTLRNAIDADLHRETERMWRLFREIIEGLAHIHQQGMIHRDLKPVNIFLDVHDRAKIGDFGLATTTPFSKHDVATEAKSPDVSGTHTGKTGMVGTFLYTAPESSSDRVYTQKVDIYSLGVIFFEMSYPCQTKMERARNLARIREPDIKLPDDAEEYLSQQQVHLLKWLLQHDPLKRPSSHDLITSEYLPPPVIEEAELNEMLRHTVSNPRSKLYKRLLGSLFQQKWNYTDEYLYDNDDIRETECYLRYSMYFSFIKDRLEAIMKLHGAQNIYVPLLTPQWNLYDAEDNVSYLMDQDGCLVHLPRDSRIPFARFVARKGLPFVKRYIIDRVYRSKRVYRCHPKMFFECSFDIIATSASDDKLHQAEVLSVVDEVLSKFAFMENPECAPKLLLNHFGLLKALLLYTGVSEESKQEKVVKVLRSSRQMSKLHLQNRLSDLSLSENTINLLLQFCEVEDSLPAVQALYVRILHGKNPASRIAAEAFEELDAIRVFLESISFSRPWFIVPCLVHDYNVNISGLLFEVVRTVSKKSKNKKFLEILCRGGRYDNIVNNFRKRADRQEQLLVYKAVGVSFSVDNFVRLATEYDKTSYVDSVLCSTGHDPMNIERFELLRSLWTNNISCTTMNPAFSVEEVSQHCRDTNVNLVLLLKDTEPGMVKVRSFDKYKYGEERIPISTAAKAITAKLEKTEKSETQGASKETVSTSKKEERAYTVESLIKVNILSQEKLSALQRKRVENHVVTVLKGTLFRCINDKLFVEVFAVDMDIHHVRNFVVSLNVESDEKAFSASVKELLERTDSSSTKAYYASICEKIRELTFESSLCAAFVVFGRKDNSFKIVLCPANCKL